MSQFSTKPSRLVRFICSEQSSNALIHTLVQALLLICQC